MMNKKKSIVDVKPILKEKDKEDKGLALQLVPEYVDKRKFQQGNHNPNYVFAGALYIPRDLIQIVNANDTGGAAKIYMGPVKDGANVFHSEDQSVTIEDPDIRKYVIRILRYFKYDPDEAMATLREASFKIKNRARGIVKRTYSQNTVTKLQAWSAKIKYSEEESGEDMLALQSHSVSGQKVPLTEEEDKDDCFYDGELYDVNKQSFIHRTITRLFPTKSTTKIDKSQREISSSDTNGPYSSEGERSSRKNKKWKAKKSKSLSQLINEGNKQSFGTSENKFYTPTIRGASVKKNSLKFELSLSRQDELVLSYLTAPRIHCCDIYTVMLLSFENPQNVRSQNRKKALKKMKKRLQRLDNLPYPGFELDRFYNPCYRMIPNKNGLRFNRRLPKQQRFACSDPCFETYNVLDSRNNGRHNAEVARQSVDIIADTFVDIIDSPNDPKCKVEITGHGYKGKFNVGLDPVIDEVLYQSLQNLKETYKNSRFYYETPRIDRRRNRTLSNIADNIRNYLSKVAGRNGVRSNRFPQFSSDNLVGRTSIHRGETNIYEEGTPQIIYRDMNMTPRRYQNNFKRSCSPLAKISRYLIDNEKCQYQSKYHKRNNNVRRTKKKRNINSSGSESFEERHFVRKTKDPKPPIFETSDDSLILRETSSTLDGSIRSYNRGGSKKNEEKKGSLKTKEVNKESSFPDLSYISEKDWKAANELLRKEREDSILTTDKSEPVRYMSLNEYEGEKTDNPSLLNNPTGKVVKMKETMTKTANGVTTVTQTEVVEAANQSSQCLIPSTSRDAFKEFNIMPMTHNEIRSEESNGRLAKISLGAQRHRELYEEFTAPYNKGINFGVATHKNKETSQNVGCPRSQSSRECRCYEAVEERKYINSTISRENLGESSPRKSRGYNGIVITRNAEFHGQKDSQRCTWRKGHCHCDPSSINTYALSNKMTMTPHPEITDFAQNKYRIPRRKVSVLKKVNSDPINTYYTKPYLRNSPKDDDIKINALTEIERPHIPIGKKENLHVGIPFEKSGKQESQAPEEVIVTESGKAKIRVSLGSCDTNQRQQAFLELMEVLKRKLESENQLLANNAPSHAMTFNDLEQYATVKGFQTMQAQTKTSSSKKKMETGTFKEINKTATVAVMTAGERPGQRMHFRPNALTDFEITSEKRKCIFACHRPCYCTEKRIYIAKHANAEKIIPRQTRSSESVLFKKEPASKPKADVEGKRFSISAQTNDLVEPTSAGPMRKASISKKPQEIQERKQLVSTSVITDDSLEPTSAVEIIPNVSMRKASTSKKPKEAQERKQLVSTPVLTDDSLEPSSTGPMRKTSTSKKPKEIQERKKLVSTSVITDDSLEPTSAVKIIPNVPMRKASTSKKPKEAQERKQLVSTPVLTDDSLEPSSTGPMRKTSTSKKPKEIQERKKLVSTSVITDDSLEPTSAVKIIPNVPMRKASTSKKPKEAQERKQLVSTPVLTDDSLEPSSTGPMRKTSTSKKPKEIQERKKLVTTSIQTDDSVISRSPKLSLRRSSVFVENDRTPFRLSRKSRESRPKIRTGSLFSKSLSEKTSMQANRWRRSESIMSEKLEERLRKRNISETKKTEKPRKVRRKTEKKPLRRESTLSKRGSLFVRRSLPPVEKDYTTFASGKPRQVHRSSVINQRFWIQSLSLPLKYADQTVADVKKEKKSVKKKVTKPSKASALLKLKHQVSKIYSHSSETGNSIVNSKFKRMANRRLNNTFKKKKRNFLSFSHDYENNLLSRQENDETSIIYSPPKQSKEERFIVAPIRKVSRKPGKIDSVSLVSYRKSSSSIEIITDPDIVLDPSSKLTLGPSTIHSGNSTDSTSTVISKYAKRAIISSDRLEKSSCSLLSYEESPSLVEYVENLHHLPSVPSATSDNSINSSTCNNSFKRCVINSKPLLVRKHMTTLNETEKHSHIWPENGDPINLKCFPETKEALKMVPDSPQSRKKHSMKPCHTTLEEKPSISSSTRAFRGHKRSSSESSDSKTTIISGPIEGNNRLAMYSKNFITKPPGGTLDPPRSNNISTSLMRNGIFMESAVVSERNKSFKSKFKRYNRAFMRRIQPGLNKIKSHPIVETVSSDDVESSNNANPIPGCKQFDKCSAYPSTSQKSTERLNEDSDVSDVLFGAILDNVTSKRCITETVNLKNSGKLKKEKKSYFTSYNCNINSTLCINDDSDQIDEAIESDETNCTTIGFDCSNVSFKKENSKVTKCYKVRAMDQTICSSTAWIVNSSESDLESSEINTKYIRKRSKAGEKNQDKSSAKYVMVKTDLRQSSSELLTNRRNPKRRTFVHTERTIISNEFEPRETSRKFIHSLLRKKRYATTENNHIK